GKGDRPMELLWHNCAGRPSRWRRYSEPGADGAKPKKQWQRARRRPADAGGCRRSVAGGPRVIGGVGAVECTVALYLTDGGAKFDGGARGGAQFGLWRRSGFIAIRWLENYLDF